MFSRSLCLSLPWMILLSLWHIGAHRAALWVLTFCHFYLIALFRLKRLLIRYSCGKGTFFTGASGARCLTPPAKAALCARRLRVSAELVSRVGCSSRRVG